VKLGNTDVGHIGAGMTAGFQSAPVVPKIGGVTRGAPAGSAAAGAARR
jgi:hypothetical protein